MNYIVYDLEATCWENPPPDYIQEIIEIGAFKINAFGEIRGKFNRFIKPAQHPVLSSFCKQLTGITQEDVNRAKNYQTVIEEFIDWGRIEEEDYMLCSWGNFDRKIFARHGAKKGRGKRGHFVYRSTSPGYFRCRKFGKAFFKIYG
jgi:3'-5' exoribonuclease 1